MKYRLKKYSKQENRKNKIIHNFERMRKILKIAKNLFFSKVMSFMSSMGLIQGPYCLSEYYCNTLHLDE